MKDRELAMEREEMGGGCGWEYQMCQGKGQCWCAKKKGMVIEMNIPRNENFTIQAKTLVAFVVKVIAKKSARHGLVLQFMFVVRGRLGQQVQLSTLGWEQEDVV